MINNILGVSSLPRSLSRKTRVTKVAITNVIIKSNRIKVLNSDDGSSDIDWEIIEGLIKIFIDENQIANTFRIAKDSCKQLEFLSLQLRLLGRR